MAKSLKDLKDLAVLALLLNEEDKTRKYNEKGLQVRDM